VTGGPRERAGSLGEPGDVDGPLRVPGGPLVPAHELGWRFSRASGPGGQGVNTTSSRVQLSWDVAASAALDDHRRERLLAALAGRLVDGVLVVTASEFRSQRRNREAARARLARLAAQALRPPPPRRRPTKPTKGAVERRIAGKRHRAETKRLRNRPDDR
jgi:ribosome-associated protein